MTAAVAAPICRYAHHSAADPAAYVRPAAGAEELMCMCMCIQGPHLNTETDSVAGSQAPHAVVAQDVEALPAQLGLELLALLLQLCKVAVWQILQHSKTACEPAKSWTTTLRAACHSQQCAASRCWLHHPACRTMGCMPTCPSRRMRMAMMKWPAAGTRKVKRQAVNRGWW